LSGPKTLTSNSEAASATSYEQREPVEVRVSPDELIVTFKEVTEEEALLRDYVMGVGYQ
jgi:hypothetical protein